MKNVTRASKSMGMGNEELQVYYTKLVEALGPLLHGTGLHISAAVYAGEVQWSAKLVESYGIGPTLEEALADMVERLKVMTRRELQWAGKMEKHRLPREAALAALDREFPGKTS
jgi:hypothetical protein